MRFSLIFGMLMIGLNIPGFPQTGGEKTDFQTWTDLTLNYRFSQKFSVGGDIGSRGIYSNKDWTLIYIRSRARYVFSPFFITSGGFGYFKTFNKEVDDSEEFRLYQDIGFNWPDLGFTLFRHRIRFEERFFNYETMEDQSSVRGRYMIEMQSRDFDILNLKSPFYINLFVEAYIPINESAEELFVNNARVNLGLGQRFSQKFRAEIYYIWQKSRELQEMVLKQQRILFV